jgi:tRNA 2-(methylsulfanyl)-N6-isopentenyladenosine37 hydroxylase
MAGAPLSPRALEESDAHRQGEPARSGAAGIEPPDTAAALVGGLVAVPEDDHVGRSAAKLGGGVVADVHEQETKAAERDARRPAGGPATPCIVVAGAGSHLRDRGELGEHLLTADVAGVEDVIDPGERFPHLRTDEAVGIGDDADAHACSIRPSMELLCETPRAWVELAIERFDEVLVDHAHCEKKAAASALSLLAAFPSSPGLARAMARLAREESGHLAQVLALLEKRGLFLGRDPGDPYAQGLQAMVRQPARERLLDRLLVSAAIEARSEERLRLLATHLPDPELRRFYGRLAGAERGHAELFLRLAARCEGFDARQAEVLRAEARLVRELPLRAAVH